MPPAVAADTMAAEQVTDSANSAFVGQALLDALDDDVVWQKTGPRHKRAFRPNYVGATTQVAHVSTAATTQSLDPHTSESGQSERQATDQASNSQSGVARNGGKKKPSRLKKVKAKRAKSPIPAIGSQSVDGQLNVRRTKTDKSHVKTDKFTVRRTSPSRATQIATGKSTAMHHRQIPDAVSYHGTSNDASAGSWRPNSLSTASSGPDQSLESTSMIQNRTSYIDSSANIGNHTWNGFAPSNGPFSQYITPRTAWQNPLQTLQFGLLQQFQYQQSPPTNFFSPSYSYPQYGSPSVQGTQVENGVMRNNNTFTNNSSNAKTSSNSAGAGKTDLPVRTRMTTRSMNALPKPTPTPAYFFQASQPRRAHPAGHQKLLLILDLNGTLVYRSKSSKSVKPRYRVDDFLEYILANHAVMVWSSARPENVEKMVQSLFTPDMRALLVAEWARDRLGLTEVQMQNKVQVYKQLSWVWADAQVQSRSFGTPFSQSNTVLIDDSMLKASAEPFNLVEIPEFNGFEEAVDVLGQVTAYIDWLSQHEDVSAAITDRKFQMNDGWQWNWQR